MTAKTKPAPRGWDPKRLDTVQSTNGPHETDVWLYLVGRKLEIVIQVNESGVAKSTTVHTVRLPR